jgi:hypothetical protein
MSKGNLLLLLFAVAALTGHAQQKSDVISGDFNGYSFQKFVAEVERQTAYRFYYRHEWIDSLVIHAPMYRGALADFLVTIFGGTDLKFAIRSDRQVFITKERSIATVLAAGFFPEQVRETTLPPDFDVSAYEHREVKEKTKAEKLFIIGASSDVAPDPVALSGFVLSIRSGEPVIGASVFIEGSSAGVMTDPSGFYWITLPRGRHTLRIQSVGMKTTTCMLLVKGPGKFNIEMDETVIPLKEVVVQANRDARVNSIQMGVEKLDIKTMKQMPSVLGEVDVLKVMLTLPGVQSVGEGASGLNVRGGATNQNLILYNDAVVYNPAHVFGFFSVFNPDVLKSVELYKSAITADYGGRLSSVMDISSREGNLKKFNVTGGISPITGRLAVEGPVIKDRTSFLFAIRSTYSDWLLRQLKSRELKNSKASFYDINFNINHKIDDQNSLFLSAYTSRDRFTLNSDTLYSYSDQNASLKWKRIFSNKVYGIFTGSYSRYKYEVSSDENPLDAFAMSFRVRQFSAKADVEYFPTTQHTLKAGLQITHYGLAPGTLEAIGGSSLLTEDKLQHEQGIETAVHVGDHYDITPNLTLYGGIRYSLYQYLGPRDVFRYADGVAQSPGSITDTTSFSSGKTIATYHGAEPRFSVRYRIGKTSSVKISYTRMRQYIQMLSNTVAIAPTDTWKLSDSYIKPQVADQYALGLYQNLKGVEFSAEGYYKVMENSLDFKDGAVVLMNHHIETDVLNAHGKAYGIEFMMKKAAGKLNGWISYTYSRSWLQTKGGLPGDQINNGKYYPSSYDKPHAANFIGNYKFSRRFNLSMNVVYSTGRPITIPLAKYEQNGQLYLYYSDRNEFRIPNYFRMDFSINVEGNHKVRKLAHSSWTFAIYNATGRSNAYSVYFVPKGDEIKAYKLSVFAKPIPTITYNFKF